MSDIDISYIEKSFSNAKPSEDVDLVRMVEQTVSQLEDGSLRVARKSERGWVTNEWIKKAILLYFRIRQMEVLEVGFENKKLATWVDKIPLRQWTLNDGVRAVPPSFVRRGAFVNKNTILMPSYVNIGAYVDSGTMVDTWATVGSCAQIGKNVHLSGGVGIGGVLEPVQASPVIVEDNVFIGSRCIVVEGVLVEENAVLGAGVVLTASTKIIDVSGEKEVVYKGRVPKNSVVIPGTLNKSFKAGQYGVPCALIVGQRTESTDKKTSLTQALRDHEVSV